MKNITKEELAKLILASDIIDDILKGHKFNYEYKRHFEKILYHTKRITYLLFGNSEIDDFDLIKEKTHEFLEKMVTGKVQLKDDK